MTNQDITSGKSTISKTGKGMHVRPPGPFEEMERMFGRVFPSVGMRPAGWEWPSLLDMNSFEGKLPRMDIVERDNEVLVRAELAGVDKKDIDVSVTDNTVTIKGCTKHETKEEKGDYFRSETRQGAFSRTVTLPCDVEGKKAEAHFEDGMLELTIPKLEGSKRHTIAVE